jgi:hypothetical protein
VELVGRLEGDVKASALQGHYVYVGEGNRLGVVDISDPGNPRKVRYLGIG